MITDEISGRIRILSVKDYESCVGKWVKYSEVEELIEENKSLNNLFNLQHERSLAAGKLWREATGNTCFPDLGVLLEWLMSQIKNLTSGTTELTNRIITLEEQKRKAK